MGNVIAIVVVLVVALVIVAAAAAYLHRKRASAPTPAPAPAPKARPAEVPMDGLESALAAVTDREGRPIRERIEAEAGHVDELRVPDDTGPLLRRALDHVAPGQSGDDGSVGDDTASDAEPSDDRTE